MLHTISTLFLLFIIYSFLGWILEIIVVFKDTKKLLNRGFLIGPYCPIYGCGCISMVLLLNKYLEDPIVLFIMATVICSILEYFTSYIMEKMFKARWWDYSDKKFNINGRICLENGVAFGVLGILMLYYINPFFTKILNLIPNIITYIISIIILVLFITDLCISFCIIKGFKNIAKTIHKDSTEEITKKIKELLLERGGLYKRLVTAFDFEASEKLLKDITEKVKTQAEKTKEKIILEKQKRAAEANKIKEEYKNKLQELKGKIKEEKKKKTEKLKNIK